MYILLWISFINGNFQHYQLDVYDTEKRCIQEKAKAEVLVKDAKQAVVCLSVGRN